MQFGEFDPTRKEYVITRPDTPRPWSNYLGDAEFGGVITNNAAGYVFYKSADQGRLTRYRFNSAPADLCGRYLYLRDQDDGDYWSHTWLPVAKPLSAFSTTTRHGAGYTRIDSQYSEVRSSVTYFVPRGARYEVASIRITNTSNRRRHLRLFPTIEPQCNWNATDDTKNLQYNQFITQSRLVEGIIDIGSNVNMPADPDRFTNKDQKRHTFFALAGAEASAFDADMAGFFGPHGSYARPRAVVEGRCSGSTAYGDMPFAAYQINMDLEPGESRAFGCLFGVGEAAFEGHAAATAMASEEAREAALEGVRTWWHERIGTLVVDTPDADFNAMANMWAPFNNLMTFYWSRTASLVYAGERDGLGYRDTLQDIVGAAALVPDEALSRLELLITGQYSNGGAKPVVQPFLHHPGQEPMPAQFRSDDALWLFNAVPAYVRETGETEFYRKLLPFADHGEASVFGHLRRAIEFSLERCGAHGLPCGLHADWNDCLRLGEKGESVFVAMQLRFALREYIDIADLLGENAEAAWAREQMAILDSNLETHAWDGEWFLRAFRFDGLKFGSKDNDEGRIFMNPQCWAVLSGHATGERAEKVMQAMHTELSTDYGIMLCTPPYEKTDPEVCLARLFNPGTKENGGIFNHTQGWAVLAAAALGHNDRAWEYLHNVLPSTFNACAEVREVEPYVVCQSTHSRFSPRLGAGRLSWLSGSAVWNYVAMTAGILGIEPVDSGLRIRPCLPSHWTGYTATRRFRGATYAISVERCANTSTAQPGLFLNGQPVRGDILPVLPAGSTGQVLCVI